jgi:hypothetical protein
MNPPSISRKSACDPSEHIAANPNTASSTPGYSHIPVDYLKAHATEVIVVSSFNKD